MAKVAKAIEKALRYRKPGKDIIVQYCIGQDYPDVATFRLTGALLDRLTHRVYILEANGESYRLKEAKRRRKTSTIRSAN